MRTLFFSRYSFGDYRGRIRFVMHYEDAIYEDTLGLCKNVAYGTTKYASLKQALTNKNQHATSLHVATTLCFS